jgi:hypothetical protein
LDRAAIAPGAQASAPAPVAPVAVAPVVVPADLQALEQKMLALKPTSERFSASISIAEKPKVKGPVGGFNHIFGHASSVLVPLLAMAAPARTSKALIPGEPLSACTGLHGPDAGESALAAWAHDREGARCRFGAIACGVDGRNGEPVAAV